MWSQVVFDNEPGEGSGVLRSLFTAFAEAVLSGEALPRLDGLTQHQRSSCELLYCHYSHTPHTFTPSQ